MLSNNVLLAADLVRKLTGVRVLQKKWGDGLRFKSPYFFSKGCTGVGGEFPSEVEFMFDEIMPALKAVEARLIADLRQLGVAAP